MSKKLGILLLVVVMCFGLAACNAKLSNEEGSEILQNAISETFKGEASYITIRHIDKFAMKTMSGEAKKDADGNPVMDEKLVKEVVINTYITDDEKYVAGTRLSEIIEYKYDEFGAASDTHYWAGKEKGKDTSYLIKKDLEGVYYRQTITNENIFEYPEFAKYSKSGLEDLKYWYNIKPSDYTINSASKNGAVATITLTVNENIPALHELGEFTIRITNGKINCIQVLKPTTAGDSVVVYQIDYLLAGAYITLPTTDALNAKNTTDESGNKVTKFYDNHAIVA